ncbi:hypothetical protein ykris0001_15120 [Yersinia kristensenii ATCC 33638]|nr:hypothetical protein ykris0001_15120 [Yersinia kristensenii ATCC 33638]
MKFGRKCCQITPRCSQLQQVNSPDFIKDYPAKVAIWLENY